MSVNEIEKLFYQDVFLKKKVGRGAFSKAGRGVKHGIKGGIKTEYDYLTAKEKRNLNSKVVTYQMFQSLQDINEFKRKPVEEQKLVMENWRKTYKSKEIIEALNISSKAYYLLLEKLGIERKTNPRKHQPISVEGIPTLEEFEALPEKDQRELLIDLRKEFKTEQIKQAWGKSTGGFYNIVSRLEIPTSGPNSVDRTKIPDNFKLEDHLRSDKVVPYTIFRHLPQDQQAELFDKYRKEYEKYETLAQEWGVSVGTVYGISSKLKKVEYTPTVIIDEPVKMKAAKPIEKKEKKYIAIDPVQNELEIDEVKEEKIPESKRLRWGTPVDEVKVKIPERDPLEETKKELVSQIDELSSIMINFVNSSKEKFNEVNNRLDKNERLVNQSIEAPKQDSSEDVEQIVTPTTISGMTLQYENEKEGFLLHSDIKSFISMLEKNPNSFKVSIKIEMNE